MDVMKVSVESPSEAQCWRARVTFLSNVSTGGSSESQKTSLTRTLSSGSLYSPLRLAQICVVTGRCKKNIDILFWSIINLIGAPTIPRVNLRYATHMQRGKNAKWLS